MPQVVLIEAYLTNNLLMQKVKCVFKAITSGKLLVVYNCITRFVCCIMYIDPVSSNTKSVCATVQGIAKSYRR